MRGANIAYTFSRHIYKKSLFPFILLLVSVVLNIYSTVLQFGIIKFKIWFFLISLKHVPNLFPIADAKEKTVEIANVDQ